MIAQYRGVNCADDEEPQSWRELMRETGRSDHSIKKWYKIYEKHSIHEDYEKITEK